MPDICSSSWKIGKMQSWQDNVQRKSARRKRLHAKRNKKKRKKLENKRRKINVFGVRKRFRKMRPPKWHSRTRSKRLMKFVLAVLATFL